MGKITYGPYGEFELKIGGEVRTLRFKYTALEYIEAQTGKAIFSLLQNQDALGMTFVRIALTAGVMHEFVGKRGKRKEILTEDLVRKWIEDAPEKDDLDFGDLLAALLEGIVRAVPGGNKIMDEAGSEADDDEGNEEAD